MYCACAKFALYSDTAHPVKVEILALTTKMIKFADSVIFLYIVWFFGGWGGVNSGYAKF